MPQRITVESLLPVARAVPLGAKLIARTLLVCIFSVFDVVGLDGSARSHRMTDPSYWPVASKSERGWKSRASMLTAPAVVAMPLLAGRDRLLRSQTINLPAVSPVTSVFP